VVLTDSKAQTTFEIEYDFDVANAGFGVSYGWTR
jgi:hypothetical protein